MELHEIIKVERTKKEDSQQKIADVLNLTRSQYNQSENGKRDFTVNEIINLCKYFDVSADYLLGLINNRIELSVIQESEQNDNHENFNDFLDKVARDVKENPDYYNDDDNDDDEIISSVDVNSNSLMKSNNRIKTNNYLHSKLSHGNGKHKKKKRKKH